MKRYFKADDNRGDFSTTFADMVFGLLFVFFLLTIAMVFNRSDVDAFQEKIDGIRKEVDERDSALTAIKRKYDDLKEIIGRLEKEKKRKNKALEGLRKQHRGLEERYKSLHASLKTCDDEYDRLRQVQKENIILRSDLEGLQKKYDTLREEYRDLEQTRDDLETLERMYDALRRKCNRVESERGRLEKEVKGIKGLIAKIKKILKKGGLVEILAEVARMEKELARKDKQKGSKSGEDEVPNDYTLWVELCGYRDWDLEIDAELWQGEVRIDRHDRITSDEIIKLARELLEIYKFESESYSDEEKKKHRPKIFLSVHPETQYGVVQEFLKKVRKIIAVTIVSWEER